MKLLGKLIHQDQGVAAVLTALGMVVFLGFTALVTDVGLLYLNRTRLISSTDAAALAGAQELPTNKPAAEAAARDYALQNGLNLSTLTVTVSADRNSLTVENNKIVPLAFARILGYDSGEVAAKAVAKTIPITGISGVAPLGLEKDNFVYGDRYLLKDASAKDYDQDTEDIIDTSDPDDDNNGIEDWLERDHTGARYGWFGPLVLGQEGASAYEANLTSGYSTVLRVGEVLQTQTGNIVGPTNEAITVRTQNEPAWSTWDNHPRGSSRILLVPIIEPLISPGNQTKKVKIVGFAALYVEEVQASGNQVQLYGRFIREITSGEMDETQTDYGLRGVKLVQ